MLEHSSNSSNLFALSSESSLSDLKKSKKHSYSSFVKKIKGLLQAEGDDLDELYRKVQIIVKKYFDQHQIVEFEEMYDHLVALKSNSKKMGKLVVLLQKKLLQDQVDKQKSFMNKNSDRSEDFEVTSTTRKDNMIKKQKIQAHQIKNSPIKSVDHIKQNEESVISSIKYQYTLQPLGKDSKVIDKKQKKIRTKQQVDNISSKYSPSKSNSSFQEYQSRNKHFQDKVKELMSQLNDIKYSLKNQQNQPQEESFSQVELNHSLKEDLKIKLDLSNSVKEDSHSHEVIAYNFPEKTHDASDNSKKNRMSQTKQSESLSINRESFSIQIKPEISIDRQKSNTSSLRTIGEQTSLKDEHQISKKKRQSETKPVQERKSILLSQANSITKQLQELRQVASMLQIQPQEHEDSNAKPKSEPEAFSSETRILQLTKTQTMQKESSSKKKFSQQSQPFFKEKQKQEEISEKPKEILQKISNVSSKVQITEELIPSFKKVEDKQAKMQASINVVEASSKIPEDSSIFSFSNTRFTPQALQSGYLNYVQVPIQQNSHLQNFRPYQSIRNNSISYNQRPVNLEVSTVKQGYYPYPEQQQVEIRDHHPQIRFIETQPRVNITNKNNSLVVSPKQSHQFSVTLSKSDAPVEKSQGIRISSREKLSNEKNRYSHLKHEENQRNSSLTKVRFVSPGYPLQNNSKSSFNSSNSSSKRKGLNMMLSPSMR